MVCVCYLHTHLHPFRKVGPTNQHLLLTCGSNRRGNTQPIMKATDMLIDSEMVASLEQQAVKGLMCIRWSDRKQRDDKLTDEQLRLYCCYHGNWWAAEIILLLPWKHISYCDIQQWLLQSCLCVCLSLSLYLYIYLSLFLIECNFND